MTGELARRAAISFPDEDVLVGRRFAQPTVYAMLNAYANVVPRPGYSPNGEERAWGRRLAKRFGHDRTTTTAGSGRVKSRKPTVVPVLDASRSRRTVAPRSSTSSASTTRRKGEAMIAFGWAIAEALESGTYSVLLASSSARASASSSVRDVRAP